MVLVSVTGGYTLDEAAAQSFERMSAAYGHPIPLTSSTRSTALQWRLYYGWKNNLPGYNFALKPSQSEHVTGTAIDVLNEAWDWFAAYAAFYGWIRNDPNEEWHYVWRATLDQSVTTALEDNMPLNAADATLINNVVIKVFRSKEGREIIRDAVLDTALDGGVGTVAQAIRDARIISRRTEIAVTKLHDTP